MVKKNNYDLKLFSPAKVNLFFRVLKKRSDGYHEIASLMQAIDFGDTLSFSLSNKDAFTCSDPSLPMDRSNLIVKAINLFKRQTGKKFSLKLHLDKKIPMGAGLGGGSSNAATTLHALDRLLKTNLTTDALIKMGEMLGADVPFFFSKGTAYCTGIGEILEDIVCKPMNFILAKPKALSLSTPLVYKNCKIDAVSKTSPSFFRKRYTEDFFNFIQVLVNDLEYPAFKLEKTLFRFKKELEELGFNKVIMTGSGTAFMCFGKMQIPSLSDVLFYKVSSISKCSASWYPSK
ncbi:4-(cytidine 5'-diphospho)-2-C-methyl-D-erythritol kinase [Candidatus Aerophobetes bacterium]|uniref:4-diphosphocytidyl-2-C-methyl-D-erythritol kinase n=1 Tax=Aerophobetes bacterium TaxID=2030807 RepID=A0A2A4YKE4_UNCAE|nr:MAG: 4-(cytidine 5'-diphospho)-2-C-methyl-D-erythritol kinase [Candidatus Aerophobetes bacterium]